jgi:hypothetical protein
MKNKIFLTFLGLLVGLGIGFSVTTLLRKPEKIYVLVPDIMTSSIDSNTWKIGNQEFFNTSRSIRKDYDNHIVMDFEFTSKDKN